MSARPGRRLHGQDGVFSLLLLLIFALMLLLNAYTPLMMDDYDYSFSWATGNRLSGVGDILASQAVHYQIWGGRSVTHFFAQLFLYLGKPVFNIANALMYVLLLLEICVLAGKRDAKTLLAAHGVLFLTVPFFGVAFLWLDGACNYLWGTAIALIPLVIALSERSGGMFDTDSPRGFFAAALCFIAGWTNENTACGVLAMLGLLIVWDLFSGRRVRVWRFAALAAHAAGVLLMLLAPGNFSRASQAASRGLIAEMAYRFAVVSYCLVRYAGVGLALFAVFLFIALKKKKPLQLDRLFVLVGCAGLCAYALVGSPQISDRSFTAVIVLLCAALLCVLFSSRMLEGKNAHLACAALALVLVASGVYALISVKAHGEAWLSQVAAIQAAAENGETEVTVASVPSSSAYTMTIGVERDPALWPNSTMEKYYGIRILGE